MRPEDDAAARAYLDRSPYENVFLSWTIATHKTLGLRALTLLYVDAAQIRGVAFFGRQVVLAADSGKIIDAFAKAAPAPHFERMIAGPRALVERYWERVAATHVPPRLRRASQPLLAVTPATLKGDQHGVLVRRARQSEWEQVALNSAAMIREELGYDPRAGRTDFDESIRASIRIGTWWVGTIGGELCFYCNAGPNSAQTLQLQGIWTPPHLRRKGYAGAALYGICAVLLREYPTLSLYVNDFNTPALELYARLGFSQVGEFSTLLF